MRSTQEAISVGKQHVEAEVGRVLTWNRLKAVGCKLATCQYDGVVNG